MVKKGAFVLKFLRDLPLWASAFLAGILLFFLLYRHSDFFGWVIPEGGEVPILSILFLTCVVLLIALAPNIRRSVAVVLFAFGGIIGFLSPWPISGDPYWARATVPQSAKDIWEVKRIAHAGGAISGLTYTNSFEALEANKNYFDFFELDFRITTDGQLICLHDYGEEVHLQLFDQLIESPISSEEFRSINESNGLTACDSESLRSWMIENPSKTIITDIKDDRNVENLEKLAITLGNQIDNVIPQAYSVREIDEIKQLGYSDVILTLYRMPQEELESLELDLQNQQVFALTLPAAWAPDMVPRVDELDVAIYAHTVNSHKQFAFLRNIGVDNIYTDVLNDTVLGY